MGGRSIPGVVVATWVALLGCGGPAAPPTGAQVHGDAPAAQPEPARSNPATSADAASCSARVVLLRAGRFVARDLCSGEERELHTVSEAGAVADWRVLAGGVSYLVRDAAGRRYQAVTAFDDGTLESWPELVLGSWQGEPWALVPLEESQVVFGESGLVVLAEVRDEAAIDWDAAEAPSRTAWRRFGPAVETRRVAAPAGRIAGLEAHAPLPGLSREGCAALATEVRTDADGVSAVFTADGHELIAQRSAGDDAVLDATAWCSPALVVASTVASGTSCWEGALRLYTRPGLELLLERETRGCSPQLGPGTLSTDASGRFVVYEGDEDAWVLDLSTRSLVAEAARDGRFVFVGVP